MFYELDGVEGIPEILNETTPEYEGLSPYLQEEFPALDRLKKQRLSTEEITIEQSTGEQGLSFEDALKAEGVYQPEEAVEIDYGTGEVVPFTIPAIQPILGESEGMGPRIHSWMNRRDPSLIPKILTGLRTAIIQRHY